MTHPDKILLLVEECGNLQSASTHLRFSMERTRELIQRVRDEISSEELERLESLASRFARLDVSGGDEQASALACVS